MRSYLLLNPKPKVDLSRILGKNFMVENGLISFIYKVIRSVAENGSKMGEP